MTTFPDECDPRKNLQGFYPCKTYTLGVWIYVNLDKIQQYFKWTSVYGDTITGLSFKDGYVPDGAKLDYGNLLIIDTPYCKFKENFGLRTDTQGESKSLSRAEQLKVFYENKSKIK